MFLEIVSPDAQLFEGKVDSITAPGETGFFQVLNNHAPIVSTLVKGKIKIDSSESLNKDFGLIFEKVGNIFYLYSTRKLRRDYWVKDYQPPLENFTKINTDKTIKECIDEILNVCR